MKQLAPILLLLPVGDAHAGEPVAPWSGPRWPLTDAELAFRPTGDEAYTESMSLDGVAANGDRISMTFVATNIGIGDDSAGVRISIDVGGKKIWRSQEPKKWKRSPKKLGLEIGDTTIRGTLSKIRVRNVGKDFGFDLTFEPRVPAWRPGSGRTTFGADRKRFYEYSLPMPLASVTGRVRLGNQWHPFHGIGGVDHSRVNIYPHEQATRWYRFRARTEEGMIQLATFQTTEQFGRKSVGWIVAAQDGRIIHESDTLDIDLKDLRPDPEKPDYRVPWRYEFRSGRGLSGNVRGIERTSRSNYLDSMGAVKRWVVSRFAHPIAYILRAEYEATVPVGGSVIRLKGNGEMNQTFVK